MLGEHIYWFHVLCKMSKAWKRIYISQLRLHKSSSQLKTHCMIKMNYQHGFHQWLFLNAAAATQESQMITIVSFQYGTRAIYVEHLMRADGGDNLADPDTLPLQAISEPLLWSNKLIHGYQIPLIPPQSCFIISGLFVAHRFKQVNVFLQGKK